MATGHRPPGPCVRDGVAHSFRVSAAIIHSPGTTDASTGGRHPGGGTRSTQGRRRSPGSAVTGYDPDSTAAAVRRSCTLQSRWWSSGAVDAAAARWRYRRTRNEETAVRPFRGGARHHDDRCGCGLRALPEDRRLDFRSQAASLVPLGASPFSMSVRIHRIDFDIHGGAQNAPHGRARRR